ncbi:uncharacterized protein [Pleurodeles waltl]|uniref:uncharacterized protein n=1 Tax=Pleurodeles waltl TaxID=8319 RepID=UPI003709B9BD
MYSDYEKSVQRQKLRKIKHLKKLFGPRTTCLAIIVVLLVILACIGWTIHTATEKRQPPTPTSAPMHTHVSLPPEIHARRQEYDNNTFIQMLHQHQLVTNLTDCWVCGHFPHTAAHAFQFPVFPVTAAYTCSLMSNVSIQTPLPGSRPVRRPGIITNNTLFEDFILQFQAKIHIACNCTDSPTMRRIMTLPRYPLMEYTFGPVSMKPKTISIRPRQAPLCICGQGRIPVGVSVCKATITYNTSTPYLNAPTGLYFVCGSKAYTWLPPGWSGICYIAFLLPPTFNKPPTYHRQRRDTVDQTDTSAQLFMDITKGLLPFWGPSVNSLQIRRLTRVLEATINETAGALANNTAELQATRMVALQNRMVLDVILADRGGACRIIGASCCVYIPDNSPSVFAAISRLHKIASVIHEDNGTPWSWTSGLWQVLVSWGWKVLIFLAIIAATFFTCCLCVQCGPALCGVCASMLTPKPTNIKENTERLMLQQQIDELLKIEVN